MKHTAIGAMREKYWGKRTAEQMARVYPGSKGLAAMRSKLEKESKERRQ